MLGKPDAVPLCASGIQAGIAGGHVKIERLLPDTARMPATCVRHLNEEPRDIQSMEHRQCPEDMAHHRSNRVIAVTLMAFVLATLFMYAASPACLAQSLRPSSESDETKAKLLIIELFFLFVGMVVIGFLVILIWLSWKRKKARSKKVTPRKMVRFYYFGIWPGHLASLVLLVDGMPYVRHAGELACLTLEQIEAIIVPGPFKEPPAAMIRRRKRLLSVAGPGRRACRRLSGE